MEIDIRNIPELYEEKLFKLRYSLSSFTRSFHCCSLQVGRRSFPFTMILRCRKEVREAYKTVPKQRNV